MVARRPQRLKYRRPKPKRLNKYHVNYCHYCKNKFHSEDLTKDHIVPKSLGGPNAVWNYVKACVVCNQEKGSKMPTCKCDRCRYAVRLFNREYRGY